MRIKQCPYPPSKRSWQSVAVASYSATTPVSHGASRAADGNATATGQLASTALATTAVRNTDSEHTDFHYIFGASYPILSCPPILYIYIPYTCIFFSWQINSAAVAAPEQLTVT